jgi:hypothetical protein
MQRSEAGRDGDRINVVLAAAGYNFSLLLCWLERLFRVLIRAPLAAPALAPNRLNNAPRRFFTDDRIIIEGITLRVLLRPLPGSRGSTRAFSAP